MLYEVITTYMSMLHKLEEVADRFREVEGLLSDPKILADQGRFRALSKEHSDLSEVVGTYSYNFV